MAEMKVIQSCFSTEKEEVKQKFERLSTPKFSLSKICQGQ